MTHRYAPSDAHLSPQDNFRIVCKKIAEKISSNATEPLLFVVNCSLYKPVHISGDESKLLGGLDLSSFSRLLKGSHQSCGGLLSLCKHAHGECKTSSKTWRVLQDKAKPYEVGFML